MRYLVSLTSNLMFLYNLNAIQDTTSRLLSNDHLGCNPEECSDLEDMKELDRDIHFRLSLKTLYEVEGKYPFILNCLDIQTPGQPLPYELKCVHSHRPTIYLNNNV
jgi:hypothetical protein